MQPEPLIRAQTAQIYNAMGVMSAEEIRAAERLDDATETVFSGPVTVE